MEYLAVVSDCVQLGIEPLQVSVHGLVLLGLLPPQVHLLVLFGRQQHLELVDFLRVVAGHLNDLPASPQLRVVLVDLLLVVSNALFNLSYIEIQRFVLPHQSLIVLLFEPQNVHDVL